MPRPTLPKNQRRSVPVLVKLRPGEAKALERLSRERRRAKESNWTQSAILREAFLESVGMSVT